MAHFAQIDDKNIVVQVIVAEKDVIDSEIFGDPKKWIQTSYNTYGGVHALNGLPLRKNYAGIGYFYDELRDAFIAPKPFDSWILNEQTCLWEAPVSRPNDDNSYRWDEKGLAWVKE